MADIISSIASAVAGCFVAPIGRQLGYLFNYHSNVEDLKTQVEKLEDVRDRMELSVNAARSNVEEIVPDVEKWLKKVNRITEKAGEILLEDEDKVKKRCFNGLCPNLKSRYWLSKQAKKTTEKVVVEIQDGEKFGTVAYRPARQGIVGSAPIKGYEGFESRMSTLNGIMEALRNPNINKIGVHGMGGVGKTMLVEEAARKAREDKLFDKVVMAVVSQSPNERKIQEEIASHLRLKFDDKEVESERVERLCKRLKEEKSILIILDDVWAHLDLEALGIPLGDMQNGCKIVVTSRRLDLLSNQMNIQNPFKIKELKEEEAWNLFKKMAGDSVEAPEIEPTAREVANECAGLPIAVVVVACALKKKRLHVWKNALYQLKKSAPTTIEGMNAKVYSSLKWSYDFLECEEQQLFLLCSLLPEDYQFSIQDLLYYGKGVGLFQGIEELETARNSVHALVDRLKDSCLLLDGDTSGLFKMHDVVRDVGISVASKDKQMLIVRNKVELEEWTTKEKLRFCSALSLPYTNIHELPTGLESPQLKFFLFFSEDSSLKIPDTFFEEMKQLKVLTLRNMHFSSLHFPSSLQTLCLDWCQLGDISIIGELNKLEILTFGGSNIIELPREIGQLTCLKLLDLRNCYSLKVIPSNVIARLSQLEELNMEESFNRWDVDGNASLAELKHLPRLVTLNMQILDANILPNDLVFEKLVRYKILIGDVQDWSSKNEISRTLKLVNTRILPLSGINKLLKRTEDLHLKKLNGFKSIFNDLDGEGFPDLKCLHIKNSSEIEYVINTMSSTRVKVPLSAFPNLELLLLKKLIELKEICNGQLPVDSFCNLREVKVEECKRLQNLFPLSVATRLLKLQEIEIWNCENMDGIVAEEREAAEDNNEAMDEIRFPQLHSLTLKDLPKLMCFCSKVKAVPSTSDAGRSKEIISEGEHGISIPLFNEKVAFPILEKLVIKSIAMKEIWHSQLPLPEGSFCKLKHLEVQECLHLSNIVPSNMLTRLQNMESMRVHSCGDCLEYIFDVGGINHTESRHAVRTSCELRDLDLSYLPGLINIWKNDSPGVFPLEKLSSLMVSSCPRLKNIFTTSRAKSLVQLQEIEIWNCENMDGIVAEEREAAEDNNEAMEEIRFPQLHSLTLQDLPKLMCFCSKVKAVPSTSDAGGSKEIISEGEHGISIPLFNEKVAFPILEKLVISSIAMKEMWHSQLPLPEGSFCKLKHLEVKDCFGLSKIVPSNMLMRLQNMESMTVCNCGRSLEYIFDVGGINHTESRHVLRTSCESRYLDLSDLPGLITIWKNDSPGVFPLEKLSLLNVARCPNLQNIFTTSRAKSLLQLKDISIELCDKIEEIVGKEGVDEEEAADKLVFPQVTSLYLRGLPQLKSFCQGILMSEWPFLKTLKVSSSCCNVEILASKLKETCGKVLFLVDKVAFPKLEELELVDLPKLTTVWKKDSQGLFQDTVGEIVGKEGVEEVFPQLTSLTLQNLPQLKNIGIHISEWPSLKVLEVWRCENVEILASDFSSFEKTSEKGHLGTPTKPLPLFLVDKVAFPKLETLYLGKLPKLTTVWKKDSQGLFQDTVEEIVGKELVDEVFPQLTSLTFSNLPQLKNGIHISEWPSLKILEVWNCKNVKILASDFSSFEKTSEKGHLGTPTKPLPLFLVDKVAFPNLEELDLENLPKLMAVWMKDSQGSLNFQKLSSLNICNCECLINVFTTSASKNLAQLQDNEIIEKEEEAAAAITDKIMFPQVKFLTLECLKQLKSFCEWNHILEWPSLEKLKMSECHNVEIFASELSTFKETRGKANLGTPTKQPLFLVDKVAFPKLEELKLVDLPKLTTVWKKDSQGLFQDTVEEIVGKEGVEEVFPQLTSLTLEKLPQLKNGFQISEWRSLKKLEVWTCENVEILASDFSSFEKTSEKGHLGTPTKPLPLFLVNKVAFPNLEYLDLRNLPRLIAVWMKDSQGSLNFQKLSSLLIYNCESLINVFTTSMAQKEEEAAAAITDKIMFPQVKSLTLECLKQLKSFCEWNHISEWPSLEKLKMSECHNVEIFASELSTFKETREKANLGTPTKQPLFLVDKVAFPNLEEMELNHMSSMEVIWQGQFHAHSFCKLRVLKVEKCDKILKVFPISLLRNLQNLEKFSVKECCSLENVFELQGVGETEHDSTIIEATDEKGKAIDETTVYQLNSLDLIDLPKLTSVFFPENNKFSFPYLNNVRVRKCPKLKDEWR